MILLLVKTSRMLMTSCKHPVPMFLFRVFAKVDLELHRDDRKVSITGDF